MTQTCNKSHQCYLDVSTLCVTVLECLPGASSIRVSLSKTRYRFSTKDIHQNLLNHTLPIFGFHVHHQEAQDRNPGHEGSLGLHFLTAMCWISSLNVPEAPPRQCNQPLKHHLSITQVKNKNFSPYHTNANPSIHESPFLCLRVSSLLNYYNRLPTGPGALCLPPSFQSDFHISCQKNTTVDWEVISRHGRKPQSQKGKD